MLATFLALFADMLALVSPIFLTIALGQLAWRAGAIGPNFVGDANRLFYFVGLPSLLFHKIAHADFATAFNPGQFFGTTMGFVIITVLALAGARSLAPAVRGAFAQASVRGNMSYTGLAVAARAYGDAGVLAASALLGWLVMLVNVLCVLGLLWPWGRVGDHGPRFWLKQVIINPLLLAAVFGIAWSLSGWEMPYVMDETLAIVSSVTLPLALLLIGADFRPAELTNSGAANCNYTLRRAWAVSLAKLILLPAAVGGVAYACGATGLELGVAVVLAAMPTSSAAPVFAAQLHGDVPLSRMAVLLSTLLAVVSIPLVLTALKLLGA